MAKTPVKPPNKGLTVNAPRMVTTLPTDGVLTRQGLDRAGRDMVAEHMRVRNLQWAHSSGAAFVSLLLDKSGSMLVRKDLVIASYNDYLGALRLYGNMAYSFYQFDSESYDVIYEARPVQQVPLLTPEQYRPLGGTPLYDSVIETIRRQEAMLGHNKRAIICIQTDGEDTSGTSSRLCKTLIQRKIKEGWQFQFLGASIDIYSMAQDMGIEPEWCMSYNAADTRASRLAFQTAAVRATDFLQGRTKDASFTREDRKAVKDQHTPPKLLR